jgi:glucose-1-phosphatase
MENNTTTFKNIIFDLGGVILDLDVPRTLQAFAHASDLPVETVMHLFRSSTGFEKYERGEFDDDEFRDFVRQLYGISISDHELDQCWNSMLGPIPSVKLELLTNLKAKYPTFLLSNTNTIHLNYVNSVVLPAQNIPSLDGYFHRAYYSHFMGKRKPEPEIFQQVLAENNLKASETLFLDDNADNIAGAAAVGLQTAFVNTPDFILHYFR